MNKFVLIRFYDNDASNFLGKEKLNIHCIYVDDKKKNNLLSRSNKKNTENEYLFAYQQSKSYLNLKDFKNLLELDIFLKYQTIKPLYTRGITSEQIKNLIKWSSTNTKKQKYVFFDWDQTISIQNGFFYIRHKRLIQEYLCYLVGGKNRFLLLKNLFKILHKNNCKVYILTNNDASDRNTSNDKFNYFIKLIRFLDPKFINNNLLYGFDFKKNSKNSSKIRFINSIISKLKSN